MQPYEVKLGYLGSLWHVALFEVCRDEIGDVGEVEYVLPKGASDMLGGMGFPKLDPVAPMPLHFDSQKGRWSGATRATRSRTSGTTRMPLPAWLEPWLGRCAASMTSPRSSGAASRQAGNRRSPDLALARKDGCDIRKEGRAAVARGGSRRACRYNCLRKNRNRGKRLGWHQA